MNIFTTKTALSAGLRQMRKNGQTVALVPTMGALHAGHLSLITRARQLAGTVVCSIFVNPTQFNDPADLAAYPRPVEQDIALLRETGCDILFLPEVTEMYGASEQWHLELDGLDTVLEGAQRPGHYQGVTQIVRKLIDAVQPDVALFGQKDYQQYLIIRHMVNTLHLPVRLELCPTMREAGGLAMSSRNVRLSDKGRRQALAIHRALRTVVSQAWQQPLSRVVQEAREGLQSADGVTPEYLVVCDADTLAEVEEWPAAKQPLVALAAARVEGVRLIDNLLIDN